MIDIFINCNENSDLDVVQDKYSDCRPINKFASELESNSKFDFFDFILISKQDGRLKIHIPKTNL